MAKESRRRWWQRRRRPAKQTTPDGLPAVTLPPGYVEALSSYGLRGSYGHIYRTQPNVRSVIDFLAEEVSGVKLKHYAKVPTTPQTPSGRLELEGSDLQELLNHPAPKMTRTRLWRDTVSDIGVYDIAYWRKVRLDGRVRALMRIPPTVIFPEFDPVTKLIRSYMTASGVRVPVDDLVIFPGYDPEWVEGFVSPLETLRRVLAEEYAAGVNREHTWRNATRKEGVVERPATAPIWDDAQREAWRAETEGIMAGHANAGRLLLLEDDMKFKDSSWSPEEMEYLEARRLTRQECAAAFRVDPRLVFAIADPATAEIRTGFYTDRLVPLLTRLAEEVDVQLLPEFEPFRSRQYVQFNVEEKLRGSFIDEAKIASSAVGGPFVTVNEMRARRNLPPKEGGDELFTPLNSLRGGGPQASPQNPVQTPGEQPAGVTPGGGTSSNSIVWTLSEPDRAAKDWLEAEVAWRQERVLEAVRGHLRRQEKTLGSLIGGMRKRGSVALEDVWLEERWDRELTRDLEAAGLNGQAEEKARQVNQATRERLALALAEGGDLEPVFQVEEV